MKPILKVLSYWNLNDGHTVSKRVRKDLKVLSYWNLNFGISVNSLGQTKT